MSNLKHPLILLLAAVFVLLIGVILGRGGPAFPAFILAAIIPWKFFSSSVLRASRCIAQRSSLLQQIPFPRAALPISTVLGEFVDFLFALIPLFGVMFVYGLWPTACTLYLPLIIGVQMMFTMGFALLISVCGAYFRDTPNLLTYLLRVWFYLSPALYSVDRVPERFRAVFLANPFATLFTSYRDVLMHGRPPDLQALGLTAAAGLALSVVALKIFLKHENDLAKLVA